MYIFHLSTIKLCNVIVTLSCSKNPITVFLMFPMLSKISAWKRKRSVSFRDIIATCLNRFISQVARGIDLALESRKSTWRRVSKMQYSEDSSARLIIFEHIIMLFISHLYCIIIFHCLVHVFYIRSIKQHLWDLNSKSLRRNKSAESDSCSKYSLSIWRYCFITSLRHVFSIFLTTVLLLLANQNHESHDQTNLTPAFRVRLAASQQNIVDRTRNTD